jgi:hypothetical protein
MPMIRIAALLVGGLTACATHDTSHSLGANSFDGTIGDQSLTIAQAVWVVAPQTAVGYTGQAAFVVMSTETDLCDRVGSNTVRPGEKTVTLEMVDIAGTSMSAPSASGSYTVPIESYWAPKTAWLSTSSFDAQCTHTGTGAARSGTVTVAAIAGNDIAGSFDVSLDLGGGADVSGTFAPQYCPGLENALHSTLPACQSR